MKVLAFFICLLNLPYVVISQTKQDSIHIDSLNKEAWSYLRKDPLKCIKKAKEVYLLSEKKSYSYGATKSMITCGASFFMQSMQDSARYYFGKALEVAENSNDFENQSHIHNNLGGLYNSMGMYSIALEHLQKCLELRKKYGADDCNVGATYINIANTYNRMEEFDKAIQIYNQAKRLINKDSCVHFQAVKIGSAIAYNKLGKVDEALHELEGDFSPVNTSKVLNNRGMCYIKQKKYQKALNSFKRALAFNRTSLRSPISIIGNHLNFAKTETLLGHFSKAEESLSNGKKLMKSVKFPEVRIDYYRGYADLYEAKGDFKNAYQSICKAQALKDSLQSKDLDELQSNYYAYLKVDEKERQLEQQKYKSEALELKNERERIKSSRAWWIISLLVFILLVAGLLIDRIVKTRKLIAAKNVLLNEEIEQRKYFQKRYHETSGRTLLASNLQSKREELDLKSIVLVQKQKGSDTVSIHTLNGKIYTKVKPILTLMNEDLSDSFFIMVNRGEIVNLHQIESVNQNENKVHINLPVFDLDKKKSIRTDEVLILHQQGETRTNFLKVYKDFKEKGV